MLGTQLAQVGQIISFGNMSQPFKNYLGQDFVTTIKKLTKLVFLIFERECTHLCLYFMIWEVKYLSMHYSETKLVMFQY